MTMRRFSYWEIMYLYRKADYVFLAIYPSHTHLQIAGTFRDILRAEFAATSTVDIPMHFSRMHGNAAVISKLMKPMRMLEALAAQGL